MPNTETFKDIPRDLAKVSNRGAPPCVFEQFLFGVVIRMQYNYNYALILKPPPRFKFLLARTLHTHASGIQIVSGLAGDQLAE